MTNLPDELWWRIIEIGVEKSTNSLSYKDLCCLSIICRRFNRFSSEDSLWVHLGSRDFPLFGANNNSSSSINRHRLSSKTLYKIRFEKDRARKLAAHQRAVLRVESQIAQHSRKLEEVQIQKMEETEKMKATIIQLSNLSKARQASVALNVWQPLVVRGSHKQIVEQSHVPVVSRIHALEMELKLCKQQLTGLDNAYRDESIRLEEAKEQLKSMKYHPLQVDTLTDERLFYAALRERKKKKNIQTNSKALLICF